MTTLSDLFFLAVKIVEVTAYVQKKHKVVSYLKWAKTCFQFGVTRVVKTAGIAIQKLIK